MKKHTGSAERAVAAAATDPLARLPNRPDAAATAPRISHSIPFEICVSIFRAVILTPPEFGNERGANHQPWRLLLLCKSLRSALEPLVYSRVSLTSTAALASFAETLALRPDLNRKVKSLWIAPNSLDSDFITALKPPPDGINSLPKQISLPITHIKSILRACRSLRHLALDGCLCTLKASDLFGSNCQPISVTSINPYSFLGGFSAPMFRKVQRLELCDTSLASEEVEQVRALPELRRFIWTSPRDYSDAKRDVAALFRIISPTIRTTSPLQLAVSGDQENNALPVKPYRHRFLIDVTVRTAQNRSAELGAHLKLAVRERDLDEAISRDAGPDIGQLSDSLSALSLLRSSMPKPYVDSAAHTTCVEHEATGVLLRTECFSAGDETITDEWESLRDLICGSGGAGLEEARRVARRLAKGLPASNTSTVTAKQSVPPDAGEENASTSDEEQTILEPGRALHRLWVEWCTRVESGSLEVL